MKLLSFLPFFLIVLVVGSNLLFHSVSCSDTQVTYGVCCHGFNHIKGLIVEQACSEWIRSDILWDDGFSFGGCLGYAEYRQKILGILDYWTMNLSDTFTLSDWDDRVNDTLYYFGDGIQAYEVWNEPNVYEYQYGYLNDTEAIAHYFDMLKNASDLIRAYNDTFVVVGGVFSDIYDYWAGDDWLDWFIPLMEMGANQYVDVWSIHLYAGKNEAFALEQIGALSGKPVWVTEVGYPSTDESVQAEWVETRFNNILASDVLPQILFHYELCGEYGLVDANYSKRKVFDVFTSFSCAEDEVSLRWYQNPLIFGIVIFGVVFGLLFGLLFGLYFLKRRYSRALLA